MAHDVAQFTLIAVALALSLRAIALNRRLRAATRTPRTSTPARASRPTAAYIEVVEKNRATDDTLGGSLVLPDEVRINGVPLAVPEGRTIVVHEMTFGSNEPEDVAQVTLTLFARRITIGADNDPA